MTTAPELPVDFLGPAALDGAIPDVAAPAPAQRPALKVVPDVGDVVDFDDVLRRAAPRLQRYAVRRLHDPHEAEEVVQEALLRAFQHRDRLATEDDLMAWVTVVTGRLVIDRLRVRGRAIAVAELPPGSRAGRDTADVVVARDEARIALDALEAMPARQAAVLWSREVEGLTYDEIGERYGLSEPSVRSVLHRARKTLRREYSSRGGTMPAVALVALAPWLHGLRAAGKIRSTARRVGTAAAATATGLAAFSSAPYVTPEKPAQVTPAMSPALGITSVANTHPHAHLTAATRPSGSSAAHVVAPAAPVTPTHTVMSHLPRSCHNATGATLGCTTHKAHVLYVRMPVPIDGQRWLGVSTDELDCGTLPSTPLVQCDTHGGTS